MYQAYLTIILAESDSISFVGDEHCQSPANDPTINAEGVNYNSKSQSTI